MPFSAAELLERRGYLGASESAAALGLSSFYTPLQLYKSKVDGADPIEETLPMMVGTALEPTVIRLFEKETGLWVGDRQTPMVDRSVPWRRATIDGLASDGGLVEAKTSGQWSQWGKDEDAIPAAYLYQVHHSFACLPGVRHAWVPVILAQREFRVYRVDRDEEMIQLLTAGEAEFMRRVMEKDPPPPQDADDLKILYPSDFGTEVVASIEIERAAYDLANVKVQRKVLEKQEEDLAFHVKEFMKEAALLKARDGTLLYTFKAQNRSAIDVTRLRKENPAIADAFTKESVVRVLLNKIK